MMFLSRIKMLKDVLCAELSVELLLPWCFNQNILKVFGIVKGCECFCFLKCLVWGFVVWRFCCFLLFFNLLFLLSELILDCYLGGYLRRSDYSMPISILKCTV